MEKKQEHVEAFVGSGNVFEDLGYSNPEESQAKADLSQQIHQIIKNRKLTQKKAAEIMKIDQPKVSDIIRGKLSKYTIDRLIRFLRLLGRDIEIRVKRQSKYSKETTLQVIGVESPKVNRKRISI